jgi:hypothetical protein
VILNRKWDRRCDREPVGDDLTLPRIEVFYFVSCVFLKIKEAPLLNTKQLRDYFGTNFGFCS